MSRFLLAAIALGASMAGLRPATARACGIPTGEPFVIEPDAADHTPPPSPSVRVVKVKRGDDWSQDDGCIDHHDTSCDGIALARLAVRAHDETRSTSALGFLIEADDSRVDVPGAPVLADADGNIQLSLGSRDDGESDLRFQLRVFAVDKAGNVSEQPTLVQVQSAGHGCQIASRATNGALWALLMLVLLARQRRIRT